MSLGYAALLRASALAINCDMLEVVKEEMKVKKGAATREDSRRLKA